MQSCIPQRWGQAAPRHLQWLQLQRTGHAQFSKATFPATPPPSETATPRTTYYLERLKQELVEVGKPWAKGVQGPCARPSAVQGPLGQELQLPIHTAEEVVHGHGLRPAAAQIEQ